MVKRDTKRIGGRAMTREALFDKHGEEICEYCRDNILCEYQLRLGELCEGSFCERAQDEFAEEHNIELEE